MTTVVAGNKIFATEFNDLRNRLDDIWNDGIFDKGYGRLLDDLAPDVPAQVTAGVHVVDATRLIEFNQAMIDSGIHQGTEEEANIPTLSALTNEGSATVNSVNIGLRSPFGSDLDETYFDLYSASDERKYRVYYTRIPQQYVAVGGIISGGAYILTSPDGITWTPRSNPENQLLRDIVWNGSIYCAVGHAVGSNAYIITSPDGITWTFRSNPKNANLLGIVWGQNQFVATGLAESLDAYILTSPDGTTWTEQSNPGNVNTSGIAYSPELDLFCIVGDVLTGLPYIITSPNGEDWTLRSSPFDIAGANNLDAISWNGSIFVAVGTAGGNGGYIITSPDGITWTERTPTSSTHHNGIDWDGRQFITVGVGTASIARIYTSQDGIKWHPAAAPQEINFRSIGWGNGLWIGVGDTVGGQGYIVTSPDGITWTQRSNPENVIIFAVTNTIEVQPADFIYAIVEFTAIDTVGIITTLTAAAIEAASLYDTYYEQVNDFETITLPDGTHINITNSVKGTTLLPVDGTGSVLQSTVLPFIERSSSPANSDLHDIVWSGSPTDLFIAVGNEGNGGLIQTSTDGITWIERSEPVNNAFKGIAVDDSGLLVAVGGAPGGLPPHILTSTDAITWLSRSNDGPVSEILFGVTWSPTAAVGGLWVTCGTSAMLMTSPDGTTWTTRSHPKSEDLFGVIWSPSLDLFCAVGDPDGAMSYIITSPDGITWTQRSVPETNSALLDIAWSESLGVFVTGGQSTARGRANMFQSTDGITWMEEKSLEIGFISDVYWDENTNYFWATGGREDVIPATSYVIFSDNGYDWTEVPWYNLKPQNGTASNDTVIVIVGENDIDPSIGSNDNTFTTNFATGHTFPTEADLVIAGIPDGVTGLNDLILAVDNNLYENSLTTLEANRHNIGSGVVDVQRIKTVVDVDGNLSGTYWNLYDEITEQHYYVSHNITDVIVVGNPTGEHARLITSPNGKAWTEQTNPKNTFMNGITHSLELNLFVGVGNPTEIDAYIITSPDGITWTEQTNPITAALNYIAWSPELSIFCAVGESDGNFAYIATSPDGITWTSRSNPKDKNLFGITWSPELGLFAACGAADGATDTYLLISSDGSTWTEQTNPKNLILAAITWSPELGLFCAVGKGDSDAYIITSDDGTTWNEQVNPKTFTLNGVTWSAELGLFCAVGQGDGVDSYLLTSSDGVTWNERSNPGNHILNDVAWNGENFIAVGHEAGGDSYIIISPDGTTWTDFSPAGVGVPQAITAFNNIQQPTINGATKIQVNIKQNGSTNQIAGNTESLINATGGIALTALRPALTWTERSHQSDKFLEGAVYSPSLSLFCVVGAPFPQGDNTYITTSPDAITWTQRSNPSTVQSNSVVWSPKLSLFCAVGITDQPGGFEAQLLTSPDGITWTQRSNTAGGNTLRTIFWSESLAIFITGGSSGYIATSTDGITWTERSTPSTLSYTGFAQGPSLLVGVGGNSPFVSWIATSPDGITWTERSINPQNILYWSVAYSPQLDLFCAVGLSGVVSTSPDGLTWTERSVPTAISMYEIQWLGYEFMAVGGAISDSYIVTSPDGITWTEHPNTKDTLLLKSIAYNGNLVCIVGDEDLTSGSTDSLIITAETNLLDITADSIGDNRLADEGTVPTGFAFTHITEGRNIQYELNADQIIAGRNDDWGLGVSAGTAISAEITQTFDSADEARYWYNSGCYIEFWMDISGGSATPQVEDWQALFAEVGTIRFNHEDTVSEFMPSGEVDTDVGFYDLTTSYQTIYTSAAGEGAYTDNMFFIEAKSDFVHPNTKVITFRFEFQDFHAEFSGIPAGSDIVDGNLRIHTDDRRSIDRVVAPEPVYAVLSGGDFPN